MRGVIALVLVIAGAGIIYTGWTGKNPWAQLKTAATTVAGSTAPSSTPAGASTSPGPGAQPAGQPGGMVG